MKKKLSIVLALAMICVSLLGVFVACESAEDEILKLYILAQDGLTVDEEFILPKTIGGQTDATTGEVTGGFAATWTSDKENIVIEERETDYLAKPVRPESGIAEVKLTVTVGRATKDFTVRVRAIDVYDIADAFYFELNKQTAYAGEYELASTFTYQEKEATIAWEVEEAYADILSIQDGKLVVTAASKETAVRIVAKISYGGEVATKYYKFNVSGQKSLKDLYLDSVVTTPVAGNVYKFALWQANAKKVLYATAQMSGNYIKLTENFSEAADFKLEATTGGYFLNLGGKYITLTGSWGGKYVKAAVSLADTASTVFTIGANNELIASVSAKDDSGADKTDTFYLGTYSTYNTISASATSYIKDTTTIDNTQFPARVISNAEVKIELAPKDAYLQDVITSPAANTEYKFALWQANAKKVLYATAQMSGKYIATTEDVTKAASIKLEETTGGYFLNLGGKYITLTGSWGGKYVKAAVSLETTASTVFTIGANNELVASVSAKDDNGADQTDTFYLGTYSTYNTISASATSYIKDVTTIDNSQFPSRLVGGAVINASEEPAPTPTPGPSTPTAGPTGSPAASIDCTSGPAISVTKEGSFKDYEGNDKTGGIQKSMTVNGITVINDIATSTSAVTTQYDTADRGSVRFYAGTTLTIKYTGIKHIVITTDGEKNFKSDFTVEGASVTVNGSTVTISFATAVDSITFTCTAQVRVTNIAVYTA